MAQRLFFSGIDASNHNGLWVSDGTAAGTSELSVAGASSNGLRPSTIIGYNGKVLFSGYDASNQIGLWVSDGTAAGTSELPVGGASGRGLNPYDLTTYNGKLLFRGFDASNHYGLWVSDGTAAGTSELSVAGTGSNGLNPNTITTYNDKVLFSGYDASNHIGLWVSDGTAAGTSELSVAGTGSNGLSPINITAYNGKVLFRGFDANNQSGLWVSDGTAAGTSELSVAGASSDGLSPQAIIAYNGKVLFNGYDASNRYGLWVTDGTAGGTSELSVAGASSTGGLDPYQFTAYNGKLVFDGRDASDRLGLWVTDGTAAGTSEVSVAGASTSSSNSGLEPYSFSAYNGKVVFGGFDASNQVSLWASDGTAAGTSELPVAGANSINGLYPRDLTAVDLAAPATVTALQATPSAAGPLDAGRTVSFALTSSAAVTVDTSLGSPTLALSDGGTATLDTTATTPTALVFSATVAAGQDTADLKVTGLALNGATITDAGGNALDTAAVATLAGSDTGLAIDTTAPTVPSPIPVVVPENSPGTTIGIAAPSDPSHPDAPLTVTVATLPTNGVVTLADGSTVVAAGQTLTVDQLTGLLFQPALGRFSASTTFDYTVTDPAGNASNGTATLVIGPAIGNPVVGSTTLTVAEGAPATALGIAAPTDPNYDAGQLTITVASLPADGLLTLADGSTAVTAGQTLTAAQLTGLLFTPTPGASSASGTFDYKVADPAGNTGAGSATVVIGPAPPATLALAAASDSGLAGDDLTNVAAPAITGTGLAGATVRLYDSIFDRIFLLGTATVGADGAWSVTAPKGLINGPNTLTATETDTAGNLSAASPPLVVTIDTSAVAAPTLTDTSVASDPAEPVLSGVGAANATVRLYEGEVLLGTATASGAGAWSLALPAALGTGTHSLSAIAVNAAGTSSPASPPLSVQVDAAGSYAVSAPPDAEGVTTARRYDASGSVTAVERSNVQGQLLQSVGVSTATLNIYDTAGTLIGTVSQPSSGIDSQPGFATTAQTQAAATSTGPAGSQVTLLGESHVLNSQGDDTIIASGGSATIYATGAATSVVGGSGSLLFVGGAGASTVRGGTGSSTLFGGAGGGYLEGGRGGRNVLLGSGGNTTLMGGGAGDILVGAAGRAVLVARDGGTAFGGSGASTIFGGGKGVLVGGVGSNVIVADGHSDEAAWAGTGASTLFGGGGNDTLGGSAGQTTMIGGSGNDEFIGSTGQSAAFGGAGNDVFYVGSGAMTVVEGSGSDQVLFGSGDATIAGGARSDIYDVVAGHAGGAEIISGFKVGTDHLAFYDYDQGAIAAQVSGGDTVLTLSDSTRITLVGVQQPNASLLA